MRNAILPQVTALALYFGQVVTGAVLVEIVFSYPGVGSLLLNSIKLYDFPTIYGIVFILTSDGGGLDAAGGPDLPAARPARAAGRLTMTDRVVQIAEEPDWGSFRGKLLACSRYLARNPSLLLGLALLVALGLFSGARPPLIDVRLAAPLSAPTAPPPSGALPLGSDPQGRNLLAVMIEGTWLTIRTGVIAGALGVIRRQRHRLHQRLFRRPGRPGDHLVCGRAC